MSLGSSIRRLLPLAWPVFIGQLSVVAFSTVDTVLLGRYAAEDLAALAVGTSAYIAVFIGLMGVVLAVGPIVGQLYGAGKLAAAGHQAHQAVWIALGLSLLGSTLLVFPWPFLALADASPEVAERVRGYLLALAVSLPASMLFSVYRGFNNAVSRPKAVMALQLGGLAAKVPLSAALAFGWPAAGLPALGVTGCGIATAIAMWLQALIAWRVVRRDAFYAPFELWGRGLHAPDRKALVSQLRLGIPMGLTILIEVTGFSFMAIFISRMGTTPVAGHQIAANLVSVLFMLPLAIASASSTLVAQRIGAQDLPDARRLGWHGLQTGTTLAAVIGLAVYLGREAIVGWYTADPRVVAAVLPLLAWVALFHTADAAQIVASFVLRAYRVATIPVFIYASSLWGIGLGGGTVLAFNLTGGVPASMQGAPGYWIACTTGMVVAASGLVITMGWLQRRMDRSG